MTSQSYGLEVIDIMILQFFVRFIELEIHLYIFRLMRRRASQSFKVNVFSHYTSLEHGDVY